MKTTLLKSSGCIAWIIILFIQCTDKQGETPVAIIPQPQQIQVDDGYFTLDAETAIQTIGGDEADRVGAYLAEMLTAASTFELSVNKSTESDATHSIALELNDSNKPGSYSVIIKKDRINITASDGAGLFVFALEFTGLIEIPADGIYTFSLSSDDGSTLQLGDRMVVNHDGFHGDVEKSGQVALMKGLHPLVLRYFDGGGGKSLKLMYEGPSITKQEVPENSFKTRDE